MDSSTEDCPVCQGPLQNPSQPVPCCRKVFCQSCLRRAIETRPQCPYCRSPINSTALALRSVIQSANDLQRPTGRNATFRTPRRLGPNIQALHNQIIAAGAQGSQTARISNIGLPNQAASNTAAQDTACSAITLLRRQRPRTRALFPNNAQVVAALPVIPAPNPSSLQANPSPQTSPQISPDIQSDDSDEMDLLAQIALIENAPVSGNIVRTFNCPYCQEGGLDDLDMRAHCNTNHRNDPRQVVCPVCVSLPHGNPRYCSRDFIGHLNLRHCYYIEDMTNIHQNDNINLQEAIMRSWQHT